MKKDNIIKLKKAIKEDVEWGLGKNAKNLFGSLKGRLKKSTQKMLDEADEELDPDNY